MESHPTVRTATQLATLLTLGATMLLLPSLAQADDGFSLGAGIDYSSGKYGGTQSTSILYVPVTAGYASGRMAFGLTVPYIRVTGPGGVIQGFGQIGASGSGRTYGRPARGSGQTSTTNSGLGDVIASAAYRTYSGDTASLDVVGKIKFGTADADKGLGTGENDYSAQLDLHLLPQDATSFLVTAGYKRVGAPEGIATNNVAYGTLGINRQLDDGAHAGVMLNAAQAAFAASGSQRDVTLYTTRTISPTTSMQAALLKGFADGSPDYGAKLLFTAQF